MAEVKFKADKMVAAITYGSVKRLKLKPGDKVTVIIKSTEVLVGK
jgi:molybdopterin-binding protein